MKSSVTDALMWIGMLSLVALAFGILYEGAMYQFVIMHEDAHRAINQQWGLQSNVSITRLGWADYEGSTIATIPQGLSIEDRRSLHELHSTNEIVGYNLARPLLLAIIGSAYVICTILTIQFLAKQRPAE